jgi:hypothetical protein
MPSLQDQLQSLLPAWEEEQSRIEQAKQINQNPKATMEQVTKRHLFKPTNNASRETFNAVRDFPNQQPVFYADMLEKKGFKHNTVRSLIYQMTRQNQIKQAADGGLTTVANAYVPLKSTKTVAKTKPVRAKSPAAKEGGIAALPPVGGSKHIKEGYKFTEHAPRKPEQRSLMINHNWDAQKEVDKLSVMQARALYDLLKTIFGG